MKKAPKGVFFYFTHSKSRDSYPGRKQSHQSCYEYEEYDYRKQVSDDEHPCPEYQSLFHIQCLRDSVEVDFPSEEECGKQCPERHEYVGYEHVHGVEYGS